nr:MAG TPA: hypothetical protein [Caudoviricetes sp.]
MLNQRLSACTTLKRKVSAPAGNRVILTFYSKSKPIGKPRVKCFT